MALTKTDIEKKLKDQKLDFTTKGNTITVQTSGDRTELLKSLAKSLSGKFKSSSTRSSIGEVEVGSTHIIVKKAKSGAGAGGSGAGAYITALAESAQCYYNAAAWYEKDFTDKSLRKAAGYVQASSSVDSVISELPEHWIKSCILSAKALYSKYGSKKLEFHRGSAFVNAINANFSSINKSTDFFSNINKWSPADIWMVSAAGKKTNWNFTTFEGINNFLIKAEKSKDVIGVSLKQTASAVVKKINFDKRDKSSYKYTGQTLGKRGFFQSGDVYIMYDGGEIQFRGFAPTWQGEIKGKTANHGKVSGGPLKSIVKSIINNAPMETQSVINSYIKSKSKTFYKKWYDMYTYLGQPKMTLKAFTEEAMAQDMNWQAAKYLGTQLLYILEKNPSKRQAVVSSIINYAKSQSDYSAPHIKVG